MISFQAFGDELLKIAAKKDKDWKKWDQDKGRIYDPAVTAHEAGHIRLHRKSPLVTAARVGGALVAGLGPISYLAYKVAKREVPKMLPVVAMTAGGFAPILADEAYASIKGYKSLKESKKYSPSELKTMRNKLMAAGGTYAAVPGTVLAMAGTIAAINKVNARRFAKGKATIPGDLAALGVNVGIPVAMTLGTALLSKKLREGKGPAISKEKAKEVARAIVPDVDVYATDTPIPQGSFAVPRVRMRSEKRNVQEMLKPLIRSKADRKRLSEKGGIVIAPIRDTPRGALV